MKNKIKGLIAFLCVLCMFITGEGGALLNALAVSAASEREAALTTSAVPVRTETALPALQPRLVKSSIQNGTDVTVKTRTFKAADGNTYRVKVSWDKSAGIPDDADVFITVLSEASDPYYDEYIEKSAELVGEDAEKFSIAGAFDISLRSTKTGQEYEPENDVSVEITLLNMDMDNVQLNIIHFPEEETASEPEDAQESADTEETDEQPEEQETVEQTVESEEPQEETAEPIEETKESPEETAVPTEETAEPTEEIAEQTEETEEPTVTDEQPEQPKVIEEPFDSGKGEPEVASKTIGKGASFKIGGFSVYVVLGYTVDFYLGEYEYRMGGGKTIGLKELLTLINAMEPEKLDDFIQRIDNVVFTNPSVAQVARTEDDTTVGEFLSQLGLTPQFSGDVSMEERDREMNKELVAGEWVFISLAPFVTEESMTITTVDGETLVIRVTDAVVKAAKTVKNPMVKIRTSNRYIGADGKLTTDSSARVLSNLNFTVKPDGTAAIHTKAVDQAGTYYYIPDILEYDGFEYVVNDLHYLTPCHIHGRHAIFDDDLVVHMLGAKTEELPDIVDKMTQQLMVDSGLAKESDFNPYKPDQTLSDDEVDAIAKKASNGYSTGVKNTAHGDDPASIYDVFKKAQYDVENNEMTVELKYFQKMKEFVPIDFIFVYDDSGTMETVAHHKVSGAKTTYGKEHLNDTLDYSTSQSVWCRIVLQVILQGIMDGAYDVDKANIKEKRYDIRMSPVAFASEAYYHRQFYDNYVDAKDAIGEIYINGGTEHYKAIQCVEDLVTLSNSERGMIEGKNDDQKRNAVVVYLSDFHSNANTKRAKEEAVKLKAMKNPDGENVHVYTVHMFEPDFRYDRNIASDMDSMYITTDIHEMLGVFDRITKEAIGYYVNKNLVIKDKLSSGLVELAQGTPTVSPENGIYAVDSSGHVDMSRLLDGYITPSGDVYSWTFFDSLYRLPAGNVYTKKLTFKLRDDEVFSPDMATNESAEVIKNIEDDDGGIHPTVVNRIDDQPHPKTSMTIKVGRLDKSGSQTSDIIEGAEFTLTDGTHNWGLISDADGILRIKGSGTAGLPKTVVPFTIGETYTLVQKTTDTIEDETPRMDMPTAPKWTLTVKSNGVIATPADGDPKMTVKNGQFWVWNRMHVQLMPKLIPITIQKTWAGGAPQKGVTAKFTVYGNYNGTILPLTAYDGANSKDIKNGDTLVKAAANQVTELTADNSTVKKDAQGNTVWTKVVFVPDIAGDAVFYTEDSDGNNQTYSYEITEGEVPTVTGGYYVKGNEGVVTNSETITTTIYKTTGGWEEYTGDTTNVQIHLNVGGSHYKNIFGTAYGGTIYSYDVYKNTNKVYVEFNYYPDRTQASKIEATTTFNVSMPTTRFDHDGVQFQNVQLPKEWAEKAGGTTSTNNYAKYFEITKLIFFKTDDTKLVIYDKANNNIKGDNYLALAPYTTFNPTTHYYEGDYSGYRLVFDGYGLHGRFDHEGSHELIPVTSVTSLKKLVSETITPIENKTFRNSAILTMSNTLVPTTDLTITSSWLDKSGDRESTKAIKAVTYEILDSGNNLVQTLEAPVTVTDSTTDLNGNPMVSLSAAATVTLPKLPDGKNYTVRQASYTLSNNRVVPVDSDGKFEAYSYSFSLTEGTDSTGEKYSFVNTRKMFTTSVKTKWNPQLATDEDPTGGKGLEYYLYYRTYSESTVNGETVTTVSEYRIDGKNEKSHGWESDPVEIPSYSVDGIETDVAVSPSDDLSYIYSTNVVKESMFVNGEIKSIDFIIENTELKSTVTVMKDWVDPAGETSEVARPVTFNLYAVKRERSRVVVTKTDGGTIEAIEGDSILKNIDPSQIETRVNYPRPEVSYTTQAEAMALIQQYGAVPVEEIVLDGSNEWTWTDKLSARYYYFAVESTVDGTRYNAAGMDYAYNTRYSYDQYGNTVTVSNTAFAVPVEVYKYDENGYGSATQVGVRQYWWFPTTGTGNQSVTVDKIVSDLSIKAPDGCKRDTAVYGGMRDITRIYRDGGFQISGYNRYGEINSEPAEINGVAVKKPGDVLKIYYYASDELVPVVISKAWKGDQAQIDANDGTEIKVDVKSGNEAVTLYGDSRKAENAVSGITKSNTALLNTAAASPWSKLLYAPRKDMYTVAESASTDLKTTGDVGVWTNTVSEPVGVWAEVDSGNYDDGWLKLPVQSGAPTSNSNVRKMILYFEDVDGNRFRAEVSFPDSTAQNFTTAGNTYYIPLRLPKNVPYCALTLPQTLDHGVVSNVPTLSGEKYYGIATNNGGADNNLPRFSQNGVFDNARDTESGQGIVFKDVEFVHSLPENMTGTDIEIKTVKAVSLKVYSENSYTITNTFNSYPTVEVYRYSKGGFTSAEMIYSGAYPVELNGSFKTVDSIITALTNGGKYADPTAQGYRFDTAMVGDYRDVSSISMTKFKIGGYSTKFDMNSRPLKIYYVKSDSLVPTVISQTWSGNVSDAQKNANSPVALTVKNGDSALSIYAQNSSSGNTVDSLSKDDTANVGGKAKPWSRLVYLPKADSYTLNEDVSKLKVFDNHGVENSDYGDWSVDYPANNQAGWTVVPNSDTRRVYLRIYRDADSYPDFDAFTSLTVMYKDIDGVVYENSVSFNTNQALVNRENNYIQLNVPKNVDLNTLELLQTDNSYYDDEPSTNSAGRKSYGLYFNNVTSQFGQTGYYRGRDRQIADDIMFTNVTPVVNVIDSGVSTLKVYVKNQLTVRNTLIVYSPSYLYMSNKSANDYVFRLTVGDENNSPAEKNQYYIRQGGSDHTALGDEGYYDIPIPSGSTEMIYLPGSSGLRYDVKLFKMTQTDGSYVLGDAVTDLTADNVKLNDAEFVQNGETVYMSDSLTETLREGTEFNKDDPDSSFAAALSGARKIVIVDEGFDVTFTKTDGNGDPLKDAVFTLYTDIECGNQRDRNATATSDENGNVKLEKVPTGITYMVETTVPDGYRTSLKENVTSKYIILVGDTYLKVPDERTGVWAEVLSNITQADIDAQTGSGENAKKFAIFLMDDNKAVSAPDIATFGIMNYAKAERRVILRKVSRKTATTDSVPLKGARFRIFRADLTEVTDGQKTNGSGVNIGYYESGTSGVYFIGNLPYGKYYLVEIKAPNGAAASNAGKIFELTVKEDEVQEGETVSGIIVPEEPVKQVENGTTDQIVTEFIQWAKGK